MYLLQASPCGRQSSRSPARLESINVELSAKPHCNRTSCLLRKLAFPCTFRAFKATKNTQCEEYVSWPAFRPPPEASVLFFLLLFFFYTNLNNSISATTKPSYHRVPATALIIIWFAKLYGRDKEIKLACHYTEKALVASSLLPRCEKCVLWKAKAFHCHWINTIYIPPFVRGSFLSCFIFPSFNFLFFPSLRW